MNKKIIVFAPHPDDETFGCGGTIAKRINEGCEAYVAILTDGRHAFSKVLDIASSPDPIEVKQIRKEEAIKANHVLGVPAKNLIFLDFEDGMLKEHEEEAEEKIAEILRKYRPYEVYIPSCQDGHPDHQAANRIVKKCILELKPAPISYQYSIRYKHSRIQPLMKRLVDVIRNDRIEVDISKYLDMKQKAIEEFKSQTLLISSRQKEPVIIHARIKLFLRTKETFYIEDKI